MPLKQRLREITDWTVAAAGTLALVALGGAVAGKDPLRLIRFEAAPIEPGIAVCLLLLSISLWLMNRDRFPRLGHAGALVSAIYPLARIAELGLGWKLPLLAGLTPTAAPGSFHPPLALLLGAVTVASLGLRRPRARWSVSAWLANLLIAVAVAGLMTRAFSSLSNTVFSITLGTHPALALLLIGAGTVLSRPEDKLVRMLFVGGSTGILVRRLFIGAVAAPVILSIALLGCVRLELLEIADGVIFLCSGLILSGFAISFYSTGAAMVIEEERADAESARQLLNARLQEQAARLQELVSQRTIELEEANANLRLAAQSNSLLALVAEHTTNGVIITDPVGKVEWVNAAFSRITGYTLPEIKGRSPIEVLPGRETDAAALDRMGQALKQAKPCHVEMLNYTKDGHPFWISLDLQPVSERSGQLEHFIAVMIDITDERAAQQRLISLNDRLRLATRSAALGVWEWDAQAGLSQWDARTLEIYGLTAEQHRGRPEDWVARLHPGDRERLVAAVRRLATEGNEFDHEFRIIRATDSATRLIESRAIVQRNAAGTVLRVTGADRDVTAERDAANRMAQLNERLRLALRSSNYGVWEIDATTTRVQWDDRMFEIYGLPRESFDGTGDAWRQRIHPADRHQAFDFATRVLAGEAMSYDLEFRIIHSDGSVRHIEAHGYLQCDPAGRPLRLVGLNRDITERKQLEDRLRKSEEMAREVATIAQIGGWEYDFETESLAWTDGMRPIHEVDDAFVPSIENTRGYYPENPMDVWPGLASGSDHGTPAFDQEFRLITARGNERWVKTLGRTEFGPNGRPIRVHGTLQDVTARHEGDRTRRDLEMQLFQAQKMETLGTLAGGIAHDFNNLLTGIIGYHELAADSLAADHPARACLTEARGASLRARELIEQILTFGRQAPGSGHTTLELAAVFEEARRFLRSTLPANITIELRVTPDLPPILGDATQIHQVLLNLGSNAAHAMRSHGGTVTIRAEHIELTSDLASFFGGSPSGTYVKISVTDTGHGMDEATRRRIFDPFFTTKNTREGTGLGLAVVHGIVRAHRGAIDVESKPGQGATIQIYLPAATSENEVSQIEIADSPPGAGEFVCVVDDEAIVGACTQRVLEKKGYVASVYRSAEECVEAIDGGLTPCSLIVTDQTMPGMQGTDLIAHLRKRRPQLPAVLMSGYFSKISPALLDGLGQVELLAKPFTTEELARAVHAALTDVRAPV